MVQITLSNGKPKRMRAKTQEEALTKLDDLRALRRRGVNLTKQSPTRIYRQLKRVPNVGSMGKEFVLGTFE